ncbi:MAG: hypothetical protein ACE15F_18530 [bacterium]
MISSAYLLESHGAGPNHPILTCIERTKIDDQYEWHIVEYDPAEKETRVKYISNRHIDDLSWSFDHTYLAFQYSGMTYSEFMPPEEIEKKGLDPAADVGHALVILDRNYKLKTEWPNVRRYYWNPSLSNSLVAITGENSEEGIGFIPREVIVYDVDKQYRTILPNQVIDVFWALHDHKIYLQNEHVVSFDPRNMKIADTSYQGIFFSPDGSYYYSPSIEGSYFTIRRTNNDEMVHTHPALKEEYLQPQGWLEGENCLVVYDYGRKVTEIINVENGKSMQIPKYFQTKLGAYVPRLLLDESQTPFEITDDMIQSLR